MIKRASLGSAEKSIWNSDYFTIITYIKLSDNGMIETVTMQKSTFAKAPKKFEAGTPPAAEAVALGAAVEYLQNLGMQNVHNYERFLTSKLINGLKKIILN